MDQTTASQVIRTTRKDNVGIIAHQQGLPEGALIQDGTVLQEAIPMGHKVALADFKKGDPITRYGETIGYAKVDITRGAWINTGNIDLPVPPNLDKISPFSNTPIPLPPLGGYTFQGYRNADGSVGTKNILGIATSVQCVAGITKYIEHKIKRELLPKYPNVDDVVALNHTYGCGVAIDAPAAIIPIRTIQNLGKHPNFGGELMIIGLGCEKLRPERLVTNRPDSHQGAGSDQILYLQDEKFRGFQEIVGGIMTMADQHLQQLNQRKRESCAAKDLVVGMQCGGSDAFSGITGNPAAGFAADLIVRAGGTVFFSEVTEVRDAAHLLVPRTIDPDVGSKLIAELKWYDEYLAQGKADRSANPSPGNKRGGLSTVVEKALGSIAKSGTSPIVDVLGPGEQVRKKGLNFVATPASDFVCGTLQLAAGMNMHVFITGRGTPYGLAMVPVIKVSSNSKLSDQWFDLIDLDAGPIATGAKTIEAVGWELFHMILEIASGRQQVASDQLGLHNDLVIFNPGPLT